MLWTTNVRIILIWTTDDPFVLKVKSYPKSILAAVDVTLPENSGLSKKFNVTGFPTLLFYSNGKLAYPYPGDRNKKAWSITTWMRYECLVQVLMIRV